MVAGKQRGGNSQQLELGNKGDQPSLSSEQGTKGSGGEVKVTPATAGKKPMNWWLCFPREKAEGSALSNSRFNCLISILLTPHLLHFRPLKSKESHQACSFFNSPPWQGSSTHELPCPLLPTPQCQIGQDPCFIPPSHSLFSRFKKILKIHIPDPEKFFPPLVSVHGGDIQVRDWGWSHAVMRKK